MAYRFDGNVALKYPQPTPEFRYDFGISGGHFACSFWVKPEIITTNQELISICNNVGGPAATSPCLIGIRLSGADSVGSLIVIYQATLFGFCTVRRSTANLFAVDTYAHITVLMEHGMNDMHIFKDGVEITYAFSRSEAGLPPQGGSDIYFGMAAYWDGHPTGLKLISGDLTHPDLTKRFTSPIGGNFRGSMGLIGFYHAPQFSDDMPAESESLAAGYIPSFASNYIENSTLSRALLMHMALIADDPATEQEVWTGLIPTVVGTGTLTRDEQLSALWHSPPHEGGPGCVAPHPRLCLPFALPRAEHYRNPGNPADILPLVYGDLREGGMRGPCPTVLIDKRDMNADPPVERWTYCAAFHPVVSIEKVYIEDVEQVFSYDTDNSEAPIVVSLGANFQNCSPIASISFLPDPTNRMLSPEGQPTGPVTWRGRGLHDPNVTDNEFAVMENAIDQIVNLLTTWGSFELEDFEATTLAEARAKIVTQGYLTSFVVNEPQVTQDWITTMMLQVMGYWRINGREQIEFYVDDGRHFERSDCNAVAVAGRDCIDGDDGVQFVFDRQSIVNKLLCYYQWSYSLKEASNRLIDIDPLHSPISEAAYGTMGKAVTLIGLRHPENVETWAQIMLMRQDGITRVEGAHVMFTLKEGKFAHLSIGDHIAFSWPYGPVRENGNRYLNEILRIVQLSLDATRGGGYSIIAQDLGDYLTDGSGNRLTDILD